MAFENSQEVQQPIDVMDEGIRLAKNIASFDFTGSGISGSNLGKDITENVPGNEEFDTFLEMTDTPGSYANQAGKIPAVNIAETALEFVATNRAKYDGSLTRDGDGNVDVVTIVKEDGNDVLTLTRDGDRNVSTVASVYNGDTKTTTITRDGDQWITSWATV